MSRSAPLTLTNAGPFSAGFLDDNRSGMSVDAFSAQLLGESNPIKSAKFADQFFYEYSPDQPDAKGKWTSDGSSGTASASASGTCLCEQKDLDTMVDRLIRTPEGLKLYQAAKKAKGRGAEGLEIKLDKIAGAAMDPKNGIIAIPENGSEASMLEDILVELHNMTKAKEFNELQSKGIKQLSRDKYIEAMEKWEFDSVQGAARLWKGIAKSSGQDPAKMPEYGDTDEVLKLTFKQHFEKLQPAHKENYGRQWDAANSP